MFQIDYSLIKQRVVESHLIPDITGDELRYNYFCGNIEFKNSESSFVADCDWVTLLDFALCMVLIRKSMIVEGKGKYVFDLDLEDENITFKYSKGEVLITPSFEPTSINVSWSDFNNAFKRFFKALTLDILDHNALLLTNKAFYYYVNFASHLE